MSPKARLFSSSILSWAKTVVLVASLPPFLFKTIAMENSCDSASRATTKINMAIRVSTRENPASSATRHLFFQDRLVAIFPP